VSEANPTTASRGRRVLRALVILIIVAIESVGALVALTLFALNIDNRALTFDNLIALYEEPEFWLYFGVWMGGIVVAQAMLLFPVRSPKPMREKGVSLFLSLGVAALAMAMLGAGFIFVLLELSGVWAPMTENTALSLWLVFLIPLPCWLVFTPLLYAYIRKRRDHDGLSRISAGLFVGTVVESLAVIPLDVMIRRRTDCYCGESTFWTLLFCGTVGVFAFGPALFLPLLARRRKRWFASRCDWCGYDMSGSMDADRCPECGVGWRA
jgi:membrane protein implicated in regulation of membrane protease activity